MGRTAAPYGRHGRVPKRSVSSDRGIADNVKKCDHAGVPLRIAAVQAEPVLGAIDVNVSRAAKFARHAASEGADVVVFPEAFVTGYDDAVFSGPLPTLADLAWLAPLQEAADETGVVVVLNTALDRGEHRTLTDLVLAPDQTPLAAYDKQHLYDNERTVFTAGPCGFSLTIDEVELALSVCYDANFPEHAAAASAHGAVVYISSGAYFPGGGDRRDLHYAARALDNGIYVVFSGLIGGSQGFIGGSAIFDPIGRRVAHVPTFEGMAIADIDPALVARTRTEQRMWADRRDSLGRHVHHGNMANRSRRA